MNRRQAFSLYVCHALSTWNARSYEFAAVLFTAAAFPEGLRAASFVGIANSIAAILFGSAIGRWIDRGQSRLRTLLTTILINHAAVIAACTMWLLIVQGAANDADDDRNAEVQDIINTSILTGTPKIMFFLILLGLGVVESVSRKANLISIERDWVPVLAPPTVAEGYDLTHVNAIMGMIDMMCKMVAPIVVSQLIAIVSSKAAALILAVANAIPFGLEILAAKNLWRANTALRAEKENLKDSDNMHPGQMQENISEAWAQQPVVWVFDVALSYMDNLQLYFESEVWAPSLAMCITHGSILSVTGVTVVFFLDSGYSLQLVTIAETVSAFFELSSTLITPFAVHAISKTTDARLAADIPLMSVEDVGRLDEDSGDVNNGSTKSSPVVNTAITHTGLYGISTMCLILISTIPALFYLTSQLSYPIPRSETKHGSPTFHSYPFATVIILSCLAISRLGRGIFSLSTQQLGQSRVASEHRSSFAGVEVGFVSLLGLAHNVASAVFSEPKEFGILATGSWISLACSAALYIWWLRREGVQFAWWNAGGKRKYQQLEGDD
ncbi:hypothetical protein NA57DRAFT_40258 [Rhizodiscina lignyota]|uniref:Solute carrier family 40 member n=1 Tax=Rhizodiscina lignyota TaxID=1504668 RepID=A0A9P4IES6_9PEZI|nr:hypothetical protein NA57DRAFT_40258 [Rhizodiscina lignyota]